jgi:hypothetical protein
MHLLRRPHADPTKARSLPSLGDCICEFGTTVIGRDARNDRGRSR